MPNEQQLSAPIGADESTLAGLNDALVVATVLVDAARRVVYASQDSAVLTTLEAPPQPGQDLPTTLWHMRTLDDRPLSGRAHPIAAALEHGVATSGRLVYLTAPDGARLAVRVDAFPISIQSGPAAVVSYTDLTVAAALERATEEDAIRFRSAFDLTITCMGLIGPDRRLQEVNRALCSFTGYTEGELLRMDLYSLIHPDDQAAHASAIERLLAQEMAMYRTELRFVAKSGAMRWGAVSLALICDGAYRSQAIVYGVEDITARRRAEDALRTSEERLRALVANAPVALFALDADGTYAVNEGLVAGTGAELVGQSFFDVHRDHPDRLYHARRALAGSPVTYVSRTGTAVLDNRLEPLLAESGVVVGVIGVTTDITERARAEEAQRRSEARFRDLVEMAPVGIYIAGTDGVVETANAALCALYGLSARGIVGKRASQLVGSERRSDYTGKLRGQIEDGREGREEQEITTSNGRRRQVVTLSIPITGADGDPKLATFVVDMTEQKAAEALLAAAREEALVAEREKADALAAANAELARSNGELQQFAYVTSHDLQEPLRTISSYMGLLRRRYSGRELDAEADEFIDYAVDGARRMSTLIQALLGYSRAGSQPTEMVDIELDDVLDSALSGLRLAIEESGATIERESLPRVIADRTLLTQLFQNLIGNALKFCREAPSISVSAERDGAQWRIAVADNGIGVDPAFADRIFLIFQRLHTREEYDGTGIGLSICKRIVERHGGRIWVESEPGAGATFYVTLPAAAMTDATAA